MTLVYRNLLLACVTLLMLLPVIDRALGFYDVTAIAFATLISAVFYIMANTLIANAATYKEIL